MSPICIRVDQSAIASYPSSRFALAQLCTMGSPPTSASMSIILDKTLLVLKVATTLTLKIGNGPSEASSTIIQIRNHWGSSLNPWLQFVIRDLVLCEDGPSTPEGIDILELTHSVIPAFLLSIYSETPHILKTLQPLITQAWFRVLDNHHCSWVTWTRLTAGLAQMQERVVLLSEPYPEEQPLRLVFVTFLHQSAHQVKTMDIERLHDLGYFMVCHNPHLTCFAGSISPMYHPETQGSAVQALCRIISVLVKRRSLSDSREEKEAMYHLLSLALGHVVYHVREPRMVVEILQAGIVKDLLELQQPSAAERRLEEVSCEILDQISAFLLYPSVLRCFWRTNESILGSQAMMEWSSQQTENMGRCWKSLEEKTMDLQSLRRRLKERVSPLCCSRDCPGSVTRHEEAKSGRTQYLLCLGCASVMYCSTNCRSIDWKAGHRTACKDIRDEAKRTRSAGKDFLNTEHEVRFFTHWLHLQLSRIVESVEAQFRSYVAALPKDVSGNKRLIREGLKNPVLFIDIRSHPGVLTSELVQVFEPSDLNVEMERKFGPNWSSQGSTLLNEWKDPRWGVDTVWMIAFLPKTGWYPAVTRGSFPFPFVYDL
ncbi:hypothetical protein V5O48_014966 [Marasmius crinis-equi]|uniref:MYND-type domain-containing protein n=1 Tax=Marasmius crinis-equi TaxID=585013 RepID=A0ABR3EVT7_9AGAR